MFGICAIYKSIMPKYASILWRGCIHEAKRTTTRRECVSPSVLEVCTIGVPDEKRGETVKTFIVLREGAAVTEEEIKEFCRKKLAPYKVPTQVEFLKELPRSAVGKPLRRLLRDRETAKK